VIDCDFCYNGRTVWDFKARSRHAQLGWDFQVCDSCRLLLRNVIGPVMHKLTHSQIVEAIQGKMDELGITYDDLMDTTGFEPQKMIEQYEVRTLGSSEPIAVYDVEVVENG
jgi:hypothetical protein